MVVTGSLMVWEFNRPRATLHSAQLVGDVDVSHPELGVSRLSINDQPLPGTIFGVDVCGNGRPSPGPGKPHPVTRPGSWRVVEAYVRGCDLVATYEPRKEWPFTTQIYWSAPPAEPGEHVLGALSQFISLETHLLDTWPRLYVRTRLDADEALFLACDSGDRAEATSLGTGRHEVSPTGRSCCVVRRLAGAPVSCLEIMPTSDFRELVVEFAADGACDTGWELFGEFLEKGVIRRARPRSIFVRREKDIAIATALCQAMDRQRLPLTT
jgi:hypothetical protein